MIGRKWKSFYCLTVYRHCITPRQNTGFINGNVGVVGDNESCVSVLICIRCRYKATVTDHAFHRSPPYHSESLELAIANHPGHSL